MGAEREQGDAEFITRARIHVIRSKLDKITAGHTVHIELGLISRDDERGIETQGAA